MEKKEDRLNLLYKINDKINQNLQEKLEKDRKIFNILTTFFFIATLVCGNSTALIFIFLDPFNVLMVLYLSILKFLTLYFFIGTTISTLYLVYINLKIHLLLLERAITLILRQNSSLMVKFDSKKKQSKKK